MVLPYRSRIYFSDGGVGIDLLKKNNKQIMKLINIPDIEESGVYTIDAITDTGSIESELVFNVTILKYYEPAYSGEDLIGYDLVDIDVYTMCKSDFLPTRERLESSEQLKEHIIEYFNL